MKNPRIIVLRLGHRPERDKRITSHVGLTARAFGADGIWIAGLRDPNVVNTLQKVTYQWGLRDFEVQTGVHWRKSIKAWKEQEGEVIHLTMYGLHVDKVISKIRASHRDKLIVVGGPKVPSELFSLADFNVAVGHQPHSEVAALAIFLDRFFKGKSLKIIPEDAKSIIIPKSHGKRVEEQKASENES
jgi:tRNA (cytidine56-2'-O)-methyltransferase